MDTTGQGSSRLIAALTLGLPLALLGVFSVASGDFAFQWQPVPPDIPYRSELARLCGTLLAGSALAMPFARSRWAPTALASLSTVWVAFLQLPRAIAAPGDFTTWLGVAEISAIALGGWMVQFGGGPAAPRADRKSATVARLYGLALVVFGASHFMFAEFTASMVPDFLPFHLPLAYLTGAVHAGTGLMLIASWSVRAAAGLEAMMMASFTLLVHLPRVIRTPSSRLEWSMLAIALALTGSALIMRAWSAKGAPSKYTQLLGAGL